MKRKIVSCLIAASIAMGMFSVSAAHATPASTQTTALISEEVAQIMAGYFIRDYQSMPDTTWSSDTKIMDTVTLYHPDGNVSAYSFELQTNGVDTGYIVISAYPDVENKILEFSDSADPVYDEFLPAQKDTLVYTGGLNYYKEIGDDSLLSLDGVSVSKDEVPTPIEDLRDEAYLPVQTRAISDPISWANANYKGPFSAYEWKNPFEDYCEFIVMDSFSGYKNHCSPTSITNLIKIIGNYRHYSPVTSKSASQIFNTVVKLGIDNGYYINPTGTKPSYVPTYIRQSFAKFGIDVSMTSSTVTYDRVKSAINAYKPFHISLTKNPYYNNQNHGVAAYAYTRLKSQSTGYYLSFVKIADGWVADGRYLSISDLSSDKMHVITVGKLS